MRILVSEDNRFTALVLQRALEEFGHSVTLTKNGEEALQDLTIANVGKDCRHGADGYASRSLWQVAPLRHLGAREVLW